MTCQQCGVTIPESSVFCQACRTKGGASVAETKLWSSPEFLGATALYTPNELVQTILYSPETILEDRKPILGWLVVIEGTETWKVFTLLAEGRQFFVGKGKECQLTLEDPELEERHASIRVKDDKIYITDLDTVTGTLVNGAAVTRTDLHDGDEIKIGSIMVKFKKL